MMGKYGFLLQKYKIKFFPFHGKMKMYISKMMLFEDESMIIRNLE